MSYPVRIINSDKHRHVILRVTGYNVRGVPSRFELIEDDQPTRVDTEHEPVFVAATFPIEAMEGTL